jgi:hypothetical protein
VTLRIGEMRQGQPEHPSRGRLDGAYPLHRVLLEVFRSRPAGQSSGSSIPGSASEAGRQFARRSRPVYLCDKLGVLRLHTVSPPSPGRVRRMSTTSCQR